MTRYNFDMNNDSGTEDGGFENVHYSFEAEDLNTIAEKFFWFLHAAGFSYVDSVKIGNVEFHQ